MATRRYRRVLALRWNESALAAAEYAGRRRRHRLTPWMGAALVTVLVGGGVGAGFVVVDRSGCDDTAATLTVVTSPGQESVIKALAASWQEGKPSIDGRCAKVTVKGENSGAVTSALSPDWQASDDEVTRPDVWIPESNAWLLSAAARPEAARLVSGQHTSIATSPAVVAMPQSMAAALGWPDKTVNWSDIVLMNRTGKSWADYGHPEWGPIKLGFTEPATSTAGLLSVIPLADRNNDGRIALDEAKTLLIFNRSIGQEAADSATYFDQIRKAKDATAALLTVSAFPSLEHDIAQFNQTNSAVKLAAVYPGEGTVFADYPYTVLSASWVNPFREQVATAFLRYLQRDGAKRAFGAAGFRDPAGSTRFGGALLNGTAGKDQTGTVRRVVNSTATVNRVIADWTALERTTTYLAVIDTSGSMSERFGDSSRLQTVQNLVISTFSLFPADSHFGLWQFSTNLDGSKDYREVVPLVRVDDKDPTTGKPWREAAIPKVQALKASGDTGLYDTVLAAYKYMQQHWQPRQHNIVSVITDGRNQDSNGISRAALLSQLRSLAQPDRPIQVETLGLGDQVDSEELAEISTATGGHSYAAVDTADLERTALAAIFGEAPPN